MARKKKAAEADEFAEVEPVSAPRKRKKPAVLADVYLSLQFVSVAALLIGCIFMVLVLQRYDWTTP